MFGAATEQKPTTETLRMTTTEFNASPIVVTFSFDPRSTTKSMPFLGLDGLDEVFGMIGSEVNGGGLSLTDGENVRLIGCLLQLPPERTVTIAIAKAVKT